MTYPLGYPVASSETPEEGHTGGASRATRPTKDQRSSSRLSTRKVAALRERLSARDQEVLETVTRFRVMSGGQLQRLFWTEGSPETRSRLARHGLARLSDLGVLAPLARRVGGVRAGSQGLIFAVGLAGQRLVRTRDSRLRVRSPYTPGGRYLAHVLAVGQLYVELVETVRWGAIDLLAFDPEPACWRPYIGPYGARALLKPDAFAKLAIADYEFSWLLELDRATESLGTVERKARGHLSYHRSGAASRTHGVSPRVIWIVPDERRVEAVWQVLHGLPTDSHGLFEVTTSADGVAVLSSGVTP